MNKVIITDTMHPSILEMFEDIGFSVSYFPSITRTEIIQKIGGYQGLVIRSKTRIDLELLNAAPDLKFIARAGAGLDEIDLEEVEKRGIKIINAPEGNRNAVAEHTIGMILALLNNFRKGNKEIRSLVWDREGNRGKELSSSTVGIIGFGHMGSAVAARLQNFGCRILAYDKYKTDFGNEKVEEVSLYQIFEHSDILTLHIPLTEETRGMIDDRFLDRFKKKIYLINTARGEIMHLKALVKAMKNDKVAGVGLDVLENEKLGTLTIEQSELMQELFDLENVILTPHVAGWSHESYIKINETLANKIKILNLG